MKDPARLVSPGLQSAVTVDILALIADAVICTDEDGRILVFNPAAEQAFGYRADEVIGNQVEMLLPLSDRAEHVRHLHRFAAEDGVSNRLMGSRREVRGRRKNGDEFPAEAMVSRRMIDGRTILTVVHRDITERREREDLREATVRELDHRMRNLLSVVGSLISIGAASAASVEEFREALIGRLAALAATQRGLRYGAQSSTSLSGLFLMELAQYRTPDGGNISIEGPPVSVGPRAAQILALAIHELATNAAKYGAFRHAVGRVAVRVAFQGEGDEGALVIQWREEGGPPVKPPERQGFGTRLVTQVVAKALRAEMKVEYRPEGLICRMVLPRAMVEADQASEAAGFGPPYPG